MRSDRRTIRSKPLAAELQDQIRCHTQDALAELRDLIPRLEALAPRGSWLPGCVLLTSQEVGAPDCTRADPFLAVGLTLRPDLVAELAPEAEPLVGPALGVAKADEDLLDAVLRLLHLVERPRDFPVLSPGLEREIHWRLLTGPLGTLVRQVGRADDRFALVRRATRWIESRYDQPIRADDLARHIDVSVPTLNRHFREVTTMSPVQYQKQLRLQRARILLAAAPDDIAAAAHTVGYESPSQFSRGYRRLFGLSPSEDARRRASSSP